jgi:large repetitive protein
VVFTNISAQPVTNASFTDPLPIGSAGLQLVVANPATASTTCVGGTLTATPGASNFTITGATIPARASNGTGANGTCTVTLSVIGGAGSYVNTLAAAALTGTETRANNTTNTATSPGPVSASLTYSSALTAVKAFSPSTISTGGMSTVTITLGNVGSGTLNNVSVTDPLPANLVIASPAVGQTTCGGTPVITATPGASSAALSGAVIPASGQCTFQFNVVGTGGANWVNTIPIGNVTAAGGVRNVAPVTATLTNSTQGGVTITNNAAPNSLTSPGQVAVLTLTLTNGGTLPLTGLSVTDYFTTNGLIGGPPTGMVIAPTPNVATNCPGGVATATAGGTSVGLSGVSLTNGASCTVTVNVTLQTTGTVQNLIPAGAITTAQGISNTLSTTTSLSAGANIGVTKVFTPSVIKPGERSRLRITYINPLALSITNLASTDNLPAGVVVPASPNPSTTCTGATVSAPTPAQVTLSGGSLPAASNGVSAICMAEIDVQAAAAGTYLNTIGAGQVTATAGTGTANNPVPATATLEVRIPVSLAKAFSPNSVALGASSTLTITLTNPNAIPLTAASLIDNLPNNVTVALTPNAATTCAGGSVTAPVSSKTVVLTGGTIPANGACTVTVSVLSNVAGVYLNTIPAGALATAQGVTNENPASDTLRIINPPTISKQFSPTAIPANGISTLTLVFGNINATAATLTADFVDTLPISPAPIVVAPTPAIGGTCNTASVTAVAGAGTVTFVNGATIPAGGCTVTVNVTGVTEGVYTNLIPVGALQTDQGNNVQGASADLTISPLGFISGTVFRDNNVTPNGTFQQGVDTPIAGVRTSAPTAWPAAAMMWRSTAQPPPTFWATTPSPA